MPTVVLGQIKDDKTKIVYVGIPPNRSLDTFSNAEKIEAMLKTLKNSERILYSNFHNRIQIVTKGKSTDVVIVSPIGCGGVNPHYIQPYTVHSYEISSKPNAKVKFYVYEKTSDDKKVLVDSCIFITKYINVQINISNKKPNSIIDVNEILRADSINLITCNPTSFKVVGFEMNWEANGTDGGWASNSNHLTNEMKEFINRKPKVATFIEGIRLQFPDGIIRTYSDFYCKIKF